MGFDVEAWLEGWRVPLPDHPDPAVRVSLAREAACDDYETLLAGASPALVNRLLDDAAAAVVSSLDPGARGAAGRPGPLLDALEAAVFTTVALGLQFAAARGGRERWTALLNGALERAGVEPAGAVVVELAGRRG